MKPIDQENDKKQKQDEKKDDHPFLEKGYYVGKRYQLTKKLGQGAFGVIYHAYHIKSEEEFAIKLEPKKNRHNQLLSEAKLYQYFSKDKQFVFTGLPRVHYYFTENDFNVMVMDLLGPSLEDLFNKCKRKFSIKTVMMLADQMIKRLEYVHSRNFLHRDIKPDNFVVGVQKTSHKVYILDFGLAKRYLKYGEHIPYKEGKSLTGTARYASINTHLGQEQARRDDLECLGHVLIYFLLGKLPWQGLKAVNKREKYDKIMNIKIETQVEDLCHEQPREFETYLKYTRTLKFSDKPDYTYLRKLFKNHIKQNHLHYDYKYDWVQAKEKKEKPKEKPKEVKENDKQEEKDNKKEVKEPEVFTTKQNKKAKKKDKGYRKRR